MKNYVVRAFTKEMREHNDTRENYGSAPHIDVYRLEAGLYGMLDRREEEADTWGYLIAGEERAMLLGTVCDSGWAGSLCDEITGGTERITVRELREAKDHHIFYLGGGHDVEMIRLPGQSAGQGIFLDRRERRLFVGDTADRSVIDAGGRSYRTAKEFRNDMEKLCGRLDEFDYIYPGRFMAALEGTLVQDILEKLEKIPAGPENCRENRVFTERRGK